MVLVTGGDDVDARRAFGERRIVPFEGYLVADFEVGGWGCLGG